MAILVLGTLDTKGPEIAYVQSLLQAAGMTVLVADAGIAAPPTVAADIDRGAFFAEAGHDVARLAAAGDRGAAVTAAATAAAALAARLSREGKLEGIVALGGSAGTTIGTAAMRAVPFGIPKIMVSTLASGDTRPYVGSSDILMFYPVVDIAGLNRISRSVLARAAHAMVGMLRGTGPAAAEDKPVIAATMFGVTTPCVQAARALLEAAGYEVLVFHATGSGGQAMESLIHGGWITGVLDITTTELADELVGGVLSAGPDRLTAAGRRGIPQLIAPGAMDMVNFGPMETVPPNFRSRNLYAHNANVTLMRTTAAENARLGEEVGRKAAAATGPVAILLPLRGVSAIDRAGQPFFDAEADAAFCDGVRRSAGAVRIIELDCHINDPQFAETAASTLLSLIQEQQAR